MEPFLAAEFGNSSGWPRRRRERPRPRSRRPGRRSPRLLGARPHEVVFTGGGTEADNLAVKGAARAARAPVAATASSPRRFEHKGVLASCDRLGAEGFRVARVGGRPTAGSSISTRSPTRSTSAPSSCR